jgi:glycosyltransferase involved in cell wall biosynthesis
LSGATRPTILFCSQAAYVGGGVETWLEDLAAALTASGWNVVVGLAQGRHHDPRRYLEAHPHANPIAIDGILGFREQRVESLLNLFQKIRPDIIFPVNLADALYAAAAWKAHGGTSRLVTGMQKIKDPGMTQDLTICSEFIDLATTISRRVADDLRRQLSLGPGRIVHIPTGVPAPRQPPVVRDRLRSAAFIGRLDQSEKRILDLIDLIERLRPEEIEFHIVGSGPEEAVVRDRLTEDPRVHFHGLMRRADLYERIYPRVDALLLFSRYEAGPMVAWEAMAHGVVPIVSDFTGRSEEGVIRDGENALVFPVGDLERAAKLVREAMQPGALAALSRNAEKSLPPEYRFEGFARRWDSELRAALERAPRVSSAARLPRQVSPGALASLRFGARTTLFLRRLLRRTHLHSDPGGEWPHSYGS